MPGAVCGTAPSSGIGGIGPGPATVGECNESVAVRKPAPDHQAAAHAMIVGRKQRLPADDERRIRGRRSTQELLDTRHTAPPSDERDDRGDERRGREDHHRQATQLQATRNPVLHRRGLVVARIARGDEPDRADQRDQHRRQSCPSTNANEYRKPPPGATRSAGSQARQTARHCAGNPPSSAAESAPARSAEHPSASGSHDSARPPRPTCRQ